MLTAPTEPPPPVEGEDAPLVTAELEIGGMHCGACATRIQRSLGRLPAVASASVNLATTRAFVSYDPGRLDQDDLCRAVSDGGLYGLTGGRGRTDGTGAWSPTAGELGRPSRGRLAMAALVGGAGRPGDGVRPAGRCWSSAVAVEIAGGWPFLRDSGALLRQVPPAWTRSSPWEPWPRWRSAPSKPSPWAAATSTSEGAAHSRPGCTESWRR